MITTCYDKNETMKMLGKQSTIQPFWCNDRVRKEVREIFEGRPYSFTIDAAADLFMLGYIHGKRSERVKRKKSSKVGNREGVLP